ncbi:hypothetical protein [Flavobacterium sp. ACN6]|uniref:hypothetical protein n=1 Tax=Flavobacterium sp. ACN6 TaxID=1920426 RepID=UPI000BB39517|nr:hypothetical protein [Flavobacterium sp. ACN6]PBJ13254.1 hypothetical protein BSF42_16540 [Flavobacterium sp. ACN6]
MGKNYKISIPEPCHEDWNKMKPKDNGRFCMSCSKTVVDFTSMLPDEVQHFFIQNQNVCGRFNKSQLDSVSIQIPSRILYVQTQYRKMFLLALFIAMGTTLFSCADKNGNKKKIDKVEVVTDTVRTEHIMVGEPAIDDTKTKQAVVPPLPQVDHAKFEKPVTISCGETIKDKKQSSNAVKEEDSQFVTGTVMQTNAEFPGGIDQFYTFFGKEFKKPDDIYIKNLKIKISFAVEKNGSMTYMQSDPAIEKTLENEIMRVLSICPKWQAGESNGKKIKMQYSLPIAF